MPTPDRTLAPVPEPAAAISLPPLTTEEPAPVTPARPRARFLDGMQAALVLLFAFVVASTAVRNSDFWMQLAGGRLLAQGRYQFGADPFAYTTQNVYWANHAWGFDLTLYLLYAAIGGPGLVVVKALAIALLAAILLRFRRPDAGLALPAFGTLLALTAMSTRLLFQPITLSYVFLGLALWLLWRAPRGTMSGTQQLRAYGSLLLLCAVWVNCDHWFLLGPVLVALFCLGDRLGAGQPGRVTPLWLIPASVVVCLLNPHHWHAFTLPDELSAVPAAAGLLRDARFQRLYASPWQELRAAFHPAESAYLLLFLLSAASFVLNRAGLRSWRAPVWLAFAALGAWQTRTMPFFAVVAAPILALNGQDYLARLPAGSPLAAGWGWAGRGAVVALGLALPAAALTGALHNAFLRGRTVDWQVIMDPSLSRVAETLQQWRQSERLPAGERGFLFHPSLAHYCAWFGPAEQGFFDHRLSLFGATARVYEDVCTALSPSVAVSAGERVRAPGDWPAVFREYGITHVVVDDPETIRWLVQDPAEWVLVHIDGRAAIFGWRPARQGAPAWSAFDAGRAVFTAADGELGPAPDEGPERGPETPTTWSRALLAAPPRSWEAEAAATYLRLSDFTARQAEATGWLRYMAGLIGLPGGSSNAQTLATAFVLGLPGVGDSAARPSALPLLAVHAARQALRANPDDTEAYLRLGQAYLTLRDLSDERRPSPVAGLLRRLRNLQVAAALEHTLALAPEIVVAHQALANLYSEQGCLDAALDHRRKELRLLQQAGPAAGEPHAAYIARVQLVQRQTDDLERLVQDHQNAFVLRAVELRSDPLRRAQLALDLGLTRQALDDILLRAQAAQLGALGARMQLELQLLLGRPFAVRPQLRISEMRDNKDKLGYLTVPAPRQPGYAPFYQLPAYEWLVLGQAAATGDYADAQEAAAALSEQLERQYQGTRHQLERSLALALTSEVGLAAPPSALLPQMVLRVERRGMQQLRAQAEFLRTTRADIQVLSGMLYLEQGLPAKAEHAFASALSGTDTASAADQPLARTYRNRLHVLRR